MREGKVSYWLCCVKLRPRSRAKLQLQIPLDLVLLCVALMMTDVLSLASKQMHMLWLKHGMKQCSVELHAKNYTVTLSVAPPNMDAGACHSE